MLSLKIFITFLLAIFILLPGGVSSLLGSSQNYNVLYPTSRFIPRSPPCAKKWILKTFAHNNNYLGIEKCVYEIPHCAIYKILVIIYNISYSVFFDFFAIKIRLVIVSSVQFFTELQQTNNSQIFIQVIVQYVIWMQTWLQV